MMRLASLIRAVLFIQIITFVCANAAEPLRLEVIQQNPAPHLGPVNSYRLVIANRMDYPITLRREIMIERQTASGWVRDGAIQAISTCENFDDKYSSNAAVRIDAHDTLFVVPSDGWLCGEQCPQPCQQNAPHLPGTYRLVVVTVPGGQEIVSPLFSIEWLDMNVYERTDFHHTFTGTAKSYGLTIDNMAPREISIARGITILKKVPTGWSPQLGSIQAISKCDEFDLDYHLETPIRIPSRGTVSVVPWDGMMCAGQCPASCLKNYQLGPGTFRFEIVVLPEGTKLQSPPFTIH